MLDIENLGLVELNAQEKESTQGGFLGWIIVGIAVLLVLWNSEGAFDKQP